MPTPFWEWCPAPGMSKQTTLAVDTNAYGDGYEHRATRGLNPVRPAWSLAFPFVGQDRLTAYDEFLKQYAATGFWIEPPGETSPVFVVCDEWSAMISDKNNSRGFVGSLSATFRRIFNPQPFAYPLDPDFTLWSANVIARGGTVSEAQKGHVNRVIVRLKQADLWERLDRLWLLAAENTVQALTDLRHLAVATPSGVIAFAPLQGYTGDGTDPNGGHLNTHFVPIDPGQRWTLNSASCGGYIRTRRTQVIGYTLVGLGHGTTSSGIWPVASWPADGDNWSFADINGFTDGLPTPGVDASGMWIASRTNPASVDLFRNGALLGNIPGPSQELSNVPLWIGGGNYDALAPQDFSTDQIAAAFTSGGLNAAQAADLSDIINNYMGLIGAAVYP